MCVTLSGLDLHLGTPDFTVSRIENAPSERIQFHCTTCSKGWGQQCFLVCALRGLFNRALVIENVMYGYYIPPLRSSISVLVFGSCPI